MPRKQGDIQNIFTLVSVLLWPYSLICFILRNKSLQYGIFIFFLYPLQDSLPVIQQGSGVVKGKFIIHFSAGEMAGRTVFLKNRLHMKGKTEAVITGVNRFFIF